MTLWVFPWDPPPFGLTVPVLLVEKPKKQVLHHDEIVGRRSTVLLACKVARVVTGCNYKPVYSLLLTMLGVVADVQEYTSMETKPDDIISDMV